MLVIEKTLPFFFADADHAVLVDTFERHFLDGDDIGFFPQFARGIDHLREAAALMLHQHVRQEQRERLMTNQFTRAPHCVPKPKRLLLTREAGGAGAGQVFVQQFERLLFLPLQKRHFHSNWRSK